MAVTHPAGLLAGLHRYGQRDLPGLVVTLNLVAAGLPRYSVSLAGYITQITALHVTVLRELTDDEHTLPDLAASVNNHAVALAEAGRRPEALTFYQEAVTLRRELAEANRDAYLPNLARGLWGAAWVRHALNADLDKGLALIAEAVSLFVALVEHEPEAFIGLLRAALATQADILQALDRTAEADEIRTLLNPPSDRG